MRYTEYGLRITLDELEEILAHAKNQAEYHKKESCIYIKGGNKPKITQYSCYAECNPTDHTYNAK